MSVPRTPNDRPQTPRAGFQESTGWGRVSPTTLAHDPPTPTTREPFAELFADPRHYRGDCRLLRTAVRRGWLDGAAPAVREALADRFEAAMRERAAAGFATDGQRTRVLLAEIGVAIAMNAAGIADLRQATRAMFTDDPGATNGRPRERWWTVDYPDRLDANELRRRAIAEGHDLHDVHGIDAGGERIALASRADARYGVRWWLVCPRCGVRRVHLYPVAAGWRCRGCARVDYPNRRTR